VTTVACVVIVGGMIGGGSLAARWWGLEPYRIEIAADGMEARLRARNDSVLHTWPCQFSPDPITMGRLPDMLPAIIERPERYGGGRVVAIGFGATTPEWTGALCVFDLAGSLEEPLWQRRVTAEDAAEDLPERPLPAAGFVFIWGRAVDCFPEREGTELLAVFNNDGLSQTLVRIYGLDGALLFQACHDGTLSGYAYLSGPGLIVLTGIDEKRKGNRFRRICRVSSAQ